MKKKKLDFEERVEKLEDILEERLEGIENRLKGVLWNNPQKCSF